jgi:hypothetical protein
VTLFIACLLIYQAGLSWWWYLIAALLWTGEALIRFITRQTV